MASKIAALLVVFSSSNAGKAASLPSFVNHHQPVTTL
jgi:hypothetical protein